MSSSVKNRSRSFDQESVCSKSSFASNRSRATVSSKPSQSRIVFQNDSSDGEMERDKDSDIEEIVSQISSESLGSMRRNTNRAELYDFKGQVCEQEKPKKVKKKSNGGSKRSKLTEVSRRGKSDSGEGWISLDRVWLSLFIKILSVIFLMTISKTDVIFSWQVVFIGSRSRAGHRICSHEDCAQFRN